jgi:uncharacterized protein (DUF2147 family)
VQLPRRLVLLLLSLAFTSFACQSEETGFVQFAVSRGQSLTSASSVTRVTVSSSGPNVPSVSTDLVQTNGVWGGVIGNIPVGTNREFVAEAFDSGGTLLFTGSASGISIGPDRTTFVAITLQELNPPPPFSNEAPIISFVSFSDLVVGPGGPIFLQAFAHDPNPGDTLSYAWTAPAGSFSSPSDRTTVWRAPNTTGVVSLTVTVSDSRGAASSLAIAVNVDAARTHPGEGSAVLDIRFNSWPVVAALAAAPTQLDVGQSATVTATATDSDGDSLSFQWASTCAGSWTNSTSSTASFSPSVIPSGSCNNCELSVTVSDGHGGQTTGTVAICIAESRTNRFPPTIIRSYQSSLTASPSQQITLEVTANDPQNSSMTFSWSANTGTTGTPQSSADTSRVMWAAPACVPTGITPTITAIVTNAYGLSATRTFGVTGLPTCLPSGTWSATGSMISYRSGHTMTLLLNGKVLVAGAGGGFSPRTAEVYDPAAGSWMSADSMTSLRSYHTATLLPSGKVFVAGGNVAGSTVATAEVYDPATGLWSPTGSMGSLRQGHTATLVPNGKVLVTGGGADTNGRSTAEVYDPETGSWSSTSSMAIARNDHTATLLPNGKVLVAGGRSGSNYWATAEVYDPATGTWSTTGAMATARSGHTAALLPNGKVLIAGGKSGSNYWATAEVYDPATGLWSPTGSMGSPRSFYAATLLSDGEVLVAGGHDGNTMLATAEVYDPSRGSWFPVGSMALRRYSLTATLLPNGKVLVAGGVVPGGISTETAEVYSP